MKCPACGGAAHAVLSTRCGETQNRRTRECGACKYRWQTVEMYAEAHAAMEGAVKLVQGFRDYAKELQNGTA